MKEPGALRATSGVRRNAPDAIMGREREEDDPNVKPQIITNTRTAARLAWILWAASLALVAVAHAIAFASRAPLYGYWVEDTLIVPTFATLGALIVARRPGNVIGWLFLVPPTAGAMQFLSGQYATIALPAEMPAGAYAAWLSTIMQSSAVFSIIFLIMLFPTGRLLSPRWRILAWTTGLVIAVSMVSIALFPGPSYDFPSARNPFGLEDAAGIIVFLETISGWAGLACVFAVVASLVLRFHRSSGEERLQIKWFAYAATLGITAISFANLLASAFGEWIALLVWIIAPLSLPVSAAIAILKYRLYDIDLIIRKTAIYGVLTLSLLAVYFAGVAGGTRLLSPLVGEENQIAVVASTLAIAALFAPFRRRIQNFIDRRFYRQGYDAQKALEEFGERLKNRTDLEDLDSDLLSVIRKTVQPSHVSLWLRESATDEKTGADGR